jgi:preprotein translocase subunit SecE
MTSNTYSMQNSIRWIVGLLFVGAAVYGNSYYFQEPLLYRVIGVILISGLGLFILTTTQEGKEALKTVIDSRTEIRRVVWPTRTETTQTTLIVLVVITIAALILWGLDSLFGWATAALLG